VKTEVELCSLFRREPAGDILHRRENKSRIWTPTSNGKERKEASEQEKGSIALFPSYFSTFATLLLTDLVTACSSRVSWPPPPPPPPSVRMSIFECAAQAEQWQYRATAPRV